MYGVSLDRVNTIGSSVGDKCAFLSYEDYAAMEGKTVFIFEGSSGTNYSYVRQLVNHGVDVVFVQCKSNGHDSLSYNPLQDIIFDLFDGDSSTFIESDNYTFIRCTDVDSYTWEETTREEIPTEEEVILPEIVM